MSDQPFGKYQLLKKLATGGMAEVWLARQTGIENFQRSVVVKRILPHLAEDAEFVQMFLNEAKIAARFSHANIAQIFDLGRENGSYFIAMEYIHGEDLGRIMRKAWSAGQWLTKPLAIKIIAAACEGLYYAHSRADENGRPLKVVHRDVSPQNILVSFEGSVKLVDFGIAKAADQASMTRSGAIKGKFAYMSPEQASGKVLDHRSDIFALGLVLYELLTGVRPIKRENDLATLQAALECAIEPPSAVSDVPSELDPVVMRALAKSPEDRYRDARQFQVALEEVLTVQRWGANSVQISELMHTLFADRIAEEAKAEAVEQVEISLPVAEPIHTPAPTEREAPRRETPKKEAGWDAPPANLDRTTISRPDLPKAENPRAVTGSPPAVDEEWEAPPGEMQVPQQRRRNPERGVGHLRTQGPKSISEDEPVDPTVLSVSDSRPANKNVRRPTRVAPVQEDPDTTSPRPPTPSPQAAIVVRESTPSPARKRNASHNGISRKPAEMAKAEARALEQQSLPPVPQPFAVAPAQPAMEGIDSYIDMDALRSKSRKRFQVLLYVTVATAVVLMGFLFRQPIYDALNARPLDSQNIFLTVTSNEPVEVLIDHSSHAGPEAAPTHLGSAPFQAKPGAHIGDTVILENVVRGIFYKEPITYGTPGQTRTINKEFFIGSFRPMIRPQKVFGIAFYRGQQKIADYLPKNADTPISMVEGEYDLELRGELSLKAPVPVHVKVIAGKTTPTDPIDLTGKLKPTQTQ